MKIEATCETCSRPFFLSQLAPAPAGSDGRCPSCGTRFARHYVSVLPTEINNVENALNTLVSVLARLEDGNPGFRLNLPEQLRKLANEFEGAEAASPLIGS